MVIEMTNGYKKLLTLSIVVFLSACGQKIDGTYIGKDPVNGKEITLTFKPDGKLMMRSSSEKESEFTYKAEGEKYNVYTGLGPMIFTLNNDGSLNAGILGLFNKKK
jgi:hypothetical protein